MRKLVMCAAVTMFMAFNATATDKLVPQDKKELISQLFEASNFEVAHNKIIENYLMIFDSQYSEQAESPGAVALLSDYKEQYASLVGEYFSLESTITVMMQFYADTYTSEELSQLIQFYQSDVGQKWLTARPKISEAVSEVQRPRYEQFNTSRRELFQEINFALRQAGVNKVSSRQATKPMMAIEMSELLSESGFKGIFEIDVKRANILGDDTLFLNTQEDYRDRRNVSVRIKPELLADLRGKYDFDLEKYFVGKRLHVKGIAKRQPIRIKLENDKSAAYYQTHIPVSNIEQIVVVTDEEGNPLSY